MHPNRIFPICITVCLLMLGCDAPSTSEMDGLEQRIYLGEKNRAEAESSLKSMADKADQVTEQLGKVQSAEQSFARRLDGIEASLADLKNQFAETSNEPVDAPKQIDMSTMTKLENRLSELEKSAADRLVAAPVAAIPKASDKSETVDASLKSEKPSKKRNTKAGGFEINLLSWNVESEGSDPNVIAKQLAEDFNRYDVYGLSEVLPGSIELYTKALGKDYDAIATRSGFNDRLQIIYNTKKYRLVRRLELNDINFQFRYRSPLVAHLEDRATGQQLMVMNNHLARGRAEVRTKQAEQLVEWARNQNMPIVAIGDYNFDYVFKTRKGNDGFDAMMRDNIWQWVEPTELIDTNWFDNPKNPDGRDDYEGSMLDFAFVAGAATEWDRECRVIVRPGDFPDDESTSDHRPFELNLSKK